MHLAKILGFSMMAIAAPLSQLEGASAASSMQDLTRGYLGVGIQPMTADIVY